MALDAAIIANVAALGDKVRHLMINPSRGVQSGHLVAACGPCVVLGFAAQIELRQLGEWH